MSKNHLHITDLTFRYETALEPLFGGLSITLSDGWTGVVGANGVGKSTLLRLATGLLVPDTGSVSAPGSALCLEQRTDEPPAHLEEFLWSWEGAAPRLRDQFDIGLDYLERWATLSHGERKRAQVAAAIWQEPEVLAVDEPTNHLDIDARRLLTSALAEYRGVGLIVSHDRVLLDDLCSRCLFLRDYGATLRPGGITAGLAEEERELGHAREEYSSARAELGRLRKEAERRGRAAAAADKKKSKRTIDPKDKAAKSQMDVNRVTGKDAAAGKLLRQLDGRLRQAEATVEGGAPPPVRKLGVTLTGETSRSDAVFRCEAGHLRFAPDSIAEPDPDRRPNQRGAGASGYDSGPAGRAGTEADQGPDASACAGGADGADAQAAGLAHPRLRIEPTDRIALVGPNGAGKSTLIRRIVSAVDERTVVYLPQEIAASDALALIERIRSLPNDELGTILSGVSRLGSDPEALLSTELPSPGETRKLLIAEGLASRPTMVVLDEPTNHMDLPSIRCLEEALAETACALLLVSHDEAFLRRLATTWWRARANGGGAFELAVE